MRILIVTYTYPPAKSVNGFRPYYFAKALISKGHQVQVLTRHFTGSELFNEYALPNRYPYSISKENGTIVHRVPFINTWFRYYRNSFFLSTGIWRIVYLMQLILGRTSQESYNKWFKPYLEKIIKRYNFDLILVEYGPSNLVRIVNKLATDHKIPYAIDFRDAYSQEMCIKNQALLSIGKRIIIRLEKYYLKSSIHNAAFCISLSRQLLNVLGIPLEKQEIISNGFDEDEWDSISTSWNTNIFRITIAGTLYNKEFLMPFLHSIKEFIKMKLDHIEVLFIAPGSDEVINKIVETLEFPQIRIIKHRISYHQTCKWMASSVVLMYHGWRGYSGIASTKIFDYIRSGNKILIVPGDDDIIDEIIMKTKSGVIANDPTIGANQLYIWYNQWKDNIVMNSNLPSSISSYSRGSQNSNLSVIIDRRLQPR